MTTMTLNFSVLNTTTAPANVAPVMVPDRWGWAVKVVLYHVIVAIGLVANTLTFIVMKAPRLRFKSYSHYLSALAIFDSLVLIREETHVVNEILLHFKQPQIFEHFSDVGCKFLLFGETVSSLMSAWLIVVMALERLCVVAMPFKRNMWCRQKGAIIIIISLFTAMSATQFFRFFMVENHGGKCMGMVSSLDVYVPLHIYMYQFVLVSTLPIAIVLVSNLGVLYRIYSVERETQGEESASTRLTDGSGARRRSKTTCMMVYISMTYILTNLPLASLTIFLHFLLTKHGQSAQGVFVKAMPWLHVLQVFASVNYASNFFIYILSGKKFRVELGRMLSCHRRSERITSVNTRTGSTRTRDEILLTTI